MNDTFIIDGRSSFSLSLSFPFYLRFISSFLLSFFFYISLLFRSVRSVRRLPPATDSAIPADHEAEGKDEDGERERERERGNGVTSADVIDGVAIDEWTP